jgi:hypothetical protein
MNRWFAKNIQRKKSYVEGYKLLLNPSQNFMETRARAETQSQNTAYHCYTGDLMK